MRNYLKYFGGWFNVTGRDGNPNHDIDALDQCMGRDKKELAQRIGARQLVWRQTHPAHVFTFTQNEPLDMFIEMNKDTFWKFILFIGEGLVFGASAAGGFIGAAMDLAAQIPMDKSPRGTFPTKQGTDGQRLRSGKGKTTSGAVLNYLGKLYFLTSKTVFKNLFDQLKAGKITEKEALAQANAEL